jgi:MFS family permease
MPEPTSSAAGVQRRTLAILFITQVAGGVGTAVGLSVGALLAAEMVSVGTSGLAQSAASLGGALIAIPATRLVRAHGRRLSLSAAYLTAALGALLTVVSAKTGSRALLFPGFFLFGGGATAGLQSRYAAVDLAPRESYGRHLSIIVWAATLGGVVGPNLATLAGCWFGAYGIPTLAAPFVISAFLFAFAALLIFLALRPDPLLVARELDAATQKAGTAAPSGAGMRAALTAILAHPDARLGVAATAAGNIVMVGVMSMTPVHIREGGHAPADTLRIVGIVLSLHIAGMYAFAPVMGWLSDRYGRRRIIRIGAMLLLAACATAGTASHNEAQLAAGLVLLGLGWSACMVSGSALLSASIPAEIRPSVQGLSDLIMGAAGATGGALAGAVVGGFSYEVLTALAAATAASLLMPRRAAATAA